MTSDEYFSILSHIKDFPTLPSISQKIGQALENPDTSIEDIAAIVMKDPSLTAKLIKIANSSFFGFRDKIVSIQKAISFLGFKLVKQLTLTSSIIHSFTPAKKNKHINDLWKHSLGVAICAKIISRDYGVSLNQQDELFTIGLLHDIGKIITAIYFPAEYIKIIDVVKKENLFFWQAEQKVLGLTHAESGRWLAKFWNFSDKTITVITYHHAVEAGFKFISERERLFLSIIVLADIIIKDLRFGSSWDDKIATIDPLVLEFLDLSAINIKQYVAEFKKKLKDIDDFVISTL